MFDFAKAAEVAVKFADELYETEEEKQAARLKILTRCPLRTKRNLKVNKTEAAHKSLFVSGWRPAIGCGCMLGLIVPSPADLVYSRYLRF